VTGYRAIPGGSSFYNSTSDYRNIQSGQAFFVSNFAANEGTVSFSEDCKMQDAHHLTNRQSATENGRQILYAKLLSQDNVVDGNVVAFDKIFSNKIDGDDALKLNNSNENFSIKRYDKTLIVEAREEIKAVDTIFYQTSNLSKQAYKLFFIPENFPATLEAFLSDQYLNTETKINLNDTCSVDFTITADAGSAKEDRFLVVFKPVNKPIKISLNAYDKNASVVLEWNISDENEVREYRVEHATDGVNFQLLETISTSINSTAMYNYLHKQPHNGSNYYRIRIDKTNGKSEYSDVVNILIRSFETGIIVFPNPFDGENLNIRLLQQPPGKYLVELINSSGQLIISKEINHSGGNALQPINLIRKVGRGIYYMAIKNEDGEIKRLKLIY
jgi:hypothetical protein